LTTENLSFQNELISLREQVNQLQLEKEKETKPLEVRTHIIFAPELSSLSPLCFCLFCFLPQGDMISSFESLKRSVIERFTNERILELNSIKHAEYLEQVDKLIEKIKKAEKAKDKKTLFALNEELRVLTAAGVALRDGNAASADAIASLEMIQSRAKELYEELEAKEEALMIGGELEASLLCEVDRLNLLNLLKVFEVELHVSPGDDQRDENQISPEVAAQLISGLRGEVKTLSEQVIVLRSEKIVQV
jgi:hypothetical protein